MQRVPLALLGLLVVLMPVLSSAGFYDGNSLKKISESQNLMDEGQFRGYVIGIIDLDDYTEFCIPNGVKVSQASAIVKKYLTENPHEWHLQASTIVVRALKKDFPCNTQK
jgi:hypothetical protein